MLICSNCRTQMKCIKTGRDVTWKDTNQTYSGDEYECSFCGNKTILCNSAPRNSYNEDTEDHIIMNKPVVLEKTIEEGELGNIIGLYMIYDRQPKNEDIEAALKDYCSGNDIGLTRCCVEEKPGIWLVASYNNYYDN